MCSPAIKNITSLLTPIKSPVIRLSSPLNIDKWCSGDRDKTICQKLNSLKQLEVQVKSNIKCLTVEPSIRKRDIPGSRKVAKCLFSPRTPAKTQNVPQYRRSYQYIPSFDTPQRNLITARSLGRKSAGFILGKGSYGVVVKGKYKCQQVAVKVILQKKEHGRRLCLEREMNALSLKHPNIIQVHQVINQSQSDIGFVIMELSGHTNLETHLQCEILPFNIKLRYLKQTARALEYCHDKGILHLDVKPKNIIITPMNDICKLCDFGSSTCIADVKKSTSEIKGTLKYSAPELLRGETATEKTDTYAFGITMWHVIHQEIPYYNENLHIVAYKVVTQNYRPQNHTLLPKTPADCIFKECWEAEPNKRPSMSIVVKMLEEIKST